MKPIAPSVQTVVVVVLVLFAPSALVFSQPDAAKEALRLLDEGLTDQAIVLLRDAAERDVASGNSEDAASKMFILAKLLIELGQYDNAVNTMFQARQHADGTELEDSTEAWFFHSLGVAAFQEGKLGASLEAVLASKAKLPLLSGLVAESLESNVLTLESQLYLIFADELGPESETLQATEISAPEAVFLLL